MGNRIKTAFSQEAREAVYRFRYEVYIDELHKMHIAADHTNKMLSDQADDFSRLYYATDDTGIIAAVRLRNGSNICFAENEKSFYRIAAFEKYIPQSLIGITDRLMVKKEWRRSFLAHEIMQSTYIEAVKSHMQICFISCEEKLLPMYFRYGFRMYGEPVSIAHGEKRYRLIIIVHDRQHLEKMRSPFLQHLPISMDDKGYYATMLQEKTGYTFMHSLKQRHEISRPAITEAEQRSNRA